MARAILSCVTYRKLQTKSGKSDMKDSKKQRDSRNRRKYNMNEKSGQSEVRGARKMRKEAKIKFDRSHPVVLYQYNSIHVLVSL